MAIIINIDVMLAKRKMNDGKYLRFEKRQGQSDPAINTRGSL